MKNSLIFLLVTVLISLYSCSNDEPAGEKVAAVRKVVVNEPGRLEKTYEYIREVGPVHFSIKMGVRKDSSIALKFNFYHPFTFDEHLKYQEEIMDEIISDVPKKNINSVFLGRMVYTGDLILRTSRQVEAAGWDGSSYEHLKEILDNSEVLDAYQRFFDKYELQIAGVSFEKAFLMDSKQVKNYAKVTIPDNELPEKSLDARIWLIFR